MGLELDLTGSTIHEPTSGGFKPLPAGKYNVSIYDAEAGEYGTNSANAGRPNLKVQFRIEEGQTGANRRQFETIPLFTSWAPSRNKPEGSDAFSFFGFFAAVLGKSEKDFRAEVKEAAEGKGKKLKLPDAGDLMGKKLVLDLKIVNDEYAYKAYVKLREAEEAAAEDPSLLEPALTQEDFKTNDVKSFKPAGAGTAAKAAKEETVFTLT